MTAHSSALIGVAVPQQAVRADRKRSDRSRSERIAGRGLLGGLLLNIPRICWMILDALLACGGTILGSLLFVSWTESSDMLSGYDLWLTVAVLAASIILCGCVIGLYEPGTLWARSRVIVRSCLTVLIAMLSTWLIMHLLMYTSLSRRAAATGIAFYLLTACPIRLICHSVVQDIRRGLLVIGQGPLTGAIIRSVRRGSVPGYRLVGVVASERRGDEAHGARDIPIVGDISEVERLCEEHKVAEVVVADTALRNPRYQRAAMLCLRLGCRVTDENTFFESAYGEVPVSHITPHWFLAADLKGQRQEHAFLKRLFDVIAAAGALVVCLPIMLVAAAAVWLEDRGPIMYSQVRVGRGGRPFTLLKLRTMNLRAEANGSTWAAANDPRVTRVGRLLRRLRVDELPQLWNILKGEMSLVGPRPERPEFVRPLARLIPFYDERHLIKPGLTGWAQINYPYGASVADARQKLQFDLYYIKHMSLELDLVILLRTLGIFFRGSR